MPLETMPSNEENSFVEFAQGLSVGSRERLDYVLNHIGETEKSLELADDQSRVLEVLRKVIAAQSDSEAVKIAKEDLEELL